MTNDLLIIDIELITSLRRSGRGYEAELLLNAYHDGLRRYKEQDIENLDTIEAMIRQHTRTKKQIANIKRIGSPDHWERLRCSVCQSFKKENLPCKKCFQREHGRPKQKKPFPKVLWTKDGIAIK